MTPQALDDLTVRVVGLRAWVDAGPPAPREDIGPKLRQIVQLMDAPSSAVVCRLLHDLLGHPVLLVRRTAIAACGPHLDSIELRRRLALLAWWDPGEAGREDAANVLEARGYTLASLRSSAGLPH